MAADMRQTWSGGTVRSTRPCCSRSGVRIRPATRTALRIAKASGLSSGPLPYTATERESLTSKPLATR